jgi:hypothetical protein
MAEAVQQIQAVAVKRLRDDEPNSHLDSCLFVVTFPSFRMEKYSNWRVSAALTALSNYTTHCPLRQDPATGVAPFLVPLPPSTDSLPPIVQFVALPLAWSLGAVRTALIALCLLLQAVLVESLLSICVSSRRTL